MITLPDVTYVMVETVCHQLARLAMEDCLSKVKFGDVLLLTDRPEFFDGIGLIKTNGHNPISNHRTHIVPNWDNKVDWCRANWFTVPPLIRTSHILFCQWDAGVWNPDDWDDEFLKYDLIGALWQWHPNKRVGNTGFSLKSTRLARYVYSHRDQYPCDTDVEDDLLCRKYRSSLEERGFEWAPESLAHKFSYEGCGPDPRPILDSHFGFHGAFNFDKVFSGEQLNDRVDLVFQSQYIRGSYRFEHMSPEEIEHVAQTWKSKGENPEVSQKLQSPVGNREGVSDDA